MEISRGGSRGDGVVRGGTVLLSLPAALAVVDEAAARGIRVLGLEGFLIAEGATYPALSRVADLSGMGPTESVEVARSLLGDAWSEPPDPTDPTSGIDARAQGEHRVEVVLDH